MATPVSGVDGWLTINGKPIRFSAPDENQALNIREYSTYELRITASSPDKVRLFIDGKELETARRGIWDWRPEHYAGLYEMRMEAPGYAAQTTWIRVFPQKLAQPLYEKMRSDLSRVALDLLFRLDSPAVEKTMYTSPFQETSALHDYKLIRKIIEEMRDILLHVRREPHATLCTQNVQQNIRELTRFTSGVVPVAGKTIYLPEQVAAKHRLPYVPESWTLQRNHLTYDTYENRLLKQFLHKQLVAKLSSVEERAENEKKKTRDIYARYRNSEDKDKIDKLAVVIAECQQMKQRCIRWSSEQFLHTVQPTVLLGKATQVLLKHPHYSRFYQLYLRFQQRLQIAQFNTEHYITTIAQRKVSELYEMWSVFGITHIVVEELLAAGYRMISNATFYEVRKDYFQFDVQKNSAAIVLEKDTVRVEFKYEPVYPNQSKVTARSALVNTSMGYGPLMPDMAIEVYQKSVPRDVLIFDAKYRRVKEPDGQWYPNTDDIATMYRYRHNIQYLRYHPTQARRPYTVEQMVTSAYILYPANKIYTEANNRIGALPFIPNMSPQRLNEVREQLKDLLYYAYLID
jgi:hypothetical protein